MPPVSIAELEEAIVAQWSQFGLWPKGELRAEDGLVWFETPIPHLPYNGVIRTRLTGDHSVIDRVIERYRRRSVPFMWFVHPSCAPPDLDRLLVERGLGEVEIGTGMALELAGWEPAQRPAGVLFEEAVDEPSLRAYGDLNARYWEIPDDQRAQVAELLEYLGPRRVRGHRYLAYVDAEPVGKAYLSLAGPPGVASIYGMSVLPEMRGRGIAAGLTNAMVARARDAGFEHVVLMSSDMAVGVYRRAGFSERCSIRVFATTQLWSDESRGATPRHRE